MGDAEKISVSSKKTRVVVKLLKDDATSSEQQLFLEEVVAYRYVEFRPIFSLIHIILRTIFVSSPIQCCVEKH